MNDLETLVRGLAPGLELIAVATLTETGSPWVRYVAGRVGDDQSIRFLTRLSSRKVQQIQRDPRVHVTLGGRSLKSRMWLQFDGKAEISTSEAERKAFCFDGLRTFMSEVDDPEYCVVVIRPHRIEFGAIGARIPKVWEGEQLPASLS